MKNKLNSMPYAQCEVIMEGNKAHLKSYNTIVATLTNREWLEVYGLYSMTTRKHIGAFVREYCNLDYAIAKQICEDRMKLNIYTGEVVAL